MRRLNGDQFYPMGEVMNQAQILQLIEASQAMLRHELQTKHPESKYQLLMLQRSFQILKNHIENARSNEIMKQEVYEDYFKFPVSNIQQSDELLCAEMRKNYDSQALGILKKLNQLDLNVSKAE